MLASCVGFEGVSGCRKFSLRDLQGSLGGLGYGCEGLYNAVPDGLFEIEKDRLRRE
jgi:hypothetical protein